MNFWDISVESINKLIRNAIKKKILTYNYLVELMKITFGCKADKNNPIGSKVASICHNPLLLWYGFPL